MTIKPLKRARLNLAGLDHSADTAYNAAKEALDAAEAAKGVERATSGNTIDGDRFPASTRPTPQQKGRRNVHA